MTNKILNYLRSLPLETRTRVMWLIVTILVIGVGSVWVSSLKGRLGDVSTDLVVTPDSGSVLSASTYVTVEAMDKKDGKLYLYFKINNDTSDILSFSSREQITLSYKNKTVYPESMSDRQNQPFVKKVLSRTTNYGVMVFPDPDTQEAEMTFDAMYFEQRPEYTFKESSKIDFDKLNKLGELRS
jgi:hypothetical protein